jgi:thimet oligopeptidase
MHTMLTRARYSQFSGTSVPRDFVEAPSQMLENWVWDKTVLDEFAADYRDPNKRFPKDLLAKMDRVRKASTGRDYRRQISFGLIDMKLHSIKDLKEAEKMDLVGASNQILTEATTLPVQEGTAFVANFGHLMGYDGGYYGYLWAESIAQDMASVFKKSKKRFLDESIGQRLRKEIYEVGNSREIDVSIRRFLGRARSIQPFLEELGIKK